MSDDKRTAKIIPRASETPSGKVKADPLARVIDWAKQHPSVLVALLAGAGVSGGELTARLNELLALDLPSWVVLALVAAWVVFRVVRDHLTSQEKQVAALVDLKTEFRAFRDETNDRLENGSGVLADLQTVTGEHGQRLDKHTAEIAAHRERLDRIEARSA